MGQFNVGNENNPTHYLSVDTDWKINSGSTPTTISLVDGAQLTTPDGITLTFKQGAILSMISGTGLCIYRDDDLKWYLLQFYLHK